MITSQLPVPSDQYGLRVYLESAQLMQSFYPVETIIPSSKAMQFAQDAWQLQREESSGLLSLS
jgi:hypothetical protein